jgi:uncharacterized protein with PQ loop repeat
MKSIAYTGAFIWAISGVLYTISIASVFANYRFYMGLPFILSNLVGVIVVIFLAMLRPRFSKIGKPQVFVFSLLFVANIILVLLNMTR